MNPGEHLQTLARFSSWLQIPLFEQYVDEQGAADMVKKTTVMELPIYWSNGVS